MPPAFGQAARVFSVLLVFIFSGCLTSAQLVQSSLKLTSEQQSQIHDLAARVRKHTDSAGCKKSCAILVANFAGETGSTFLDGNAACSRSTCAARRTSSGNIQIASRQHLRQYLEKERIASKLLEGDNAARWLAMENGATAVLIGSLKVGMTRASIHVQLLDTHDFGKREKEVRAKGLVEEESFRDVSNFGDFEPGEPFGEPQALNASEDVYDYSKHSQRNKTAPPHCTYVPDPPYTDAARTV
jgi:hypothetical protein